MNKHYDLRIAIKARNAMHHNNTNPPTTESMMSQPESMMSQDEPSPSMMSQDLTGVRTLLTEIDPIERVRISDMVPNGYITFPLNTEGE